MANARVIITAHATRGSGQVNRQHGAACLHIDEAGRDNAADRLTGIARPA
jgi:hypothetical protein